MEKYEPLVLIGNLYLNQKLKYCIGAWPLLIYFDLWLKKGYCSETEDLLAYILKTNLKLYPLQEERKARRYKVWIRIMVEVSIVNIDEMQKKKRIQYDGRIIGNTHLPCFSFKGLECSIFSDIEWIWLLF